ncbi:MAG: MFS transporter [Novosphingobium sp.]
MNSNNVTDAHVSSLAQGELRKSWRTLVVAFAGMMCSAPVLASYCVGSFVLPLEQEFGWGRSQIQAAIFFTQAGCAICGLLVGWIAARIGVRYLAISGILGVSLAFSLAAATGGSIWYYYAAFTSLAFLGCGSIPVVWSKIITGFFDARRGVALAIALSGTGLSGTFIPPILSELIVSHGWRTGFLFLAILPLVTALPLAIAWLPGKVADGDGAAVTDIGMGNQEGVALHKAMRDYRLWLLCFSVVILYLAMTGILANLIPAMTSQGMPASSAALVQSFYAFPLIFGRVLVGMAIDRFWAPAVAVAALVPAAFGSFLLADSPDFYIAVMGASLVGVAAGAELDLIAFLTSRYFGVKYFTHIYGVIYVGVAAAGALGPVSFAWLQEATDSYALCFYVSSGALFVGAVSLLLLGPYPKQFNHLKH